MRKYLLPTMVAASLVAFAIVFVSPARAEEEKTGDSAKKPRPKDYTGEVASVDAAAKTITIKKKDETKTFSLAEDAKVSTADKKEAALADIKAGDKVHLKYREVDGKLVASRVGPPKPKKEDKEKGDEKAEGDKDKAK